MPVSITATSAANGSLRRRRKALAASEWQAKSRNWDECRWAEKAVNNEGNDMAANEDQKTFIGRRPARVKSPASRAAAARSGIYVKYYYNNE